MTIIGCVGQGFVGGSLTTVFSERNVRVFCYDKSGKIAPGGDVPHRWDLKPLENFFITNIAPNIEASPSLNPELLEASIDSLKEFGKELKSNPAGSVKELVVNSEQWEEHSKIYFVCVPTPMKESGECDTSIVESVLDELASVPGERIAVIKSTVPPGSTEKWNKKYKEQKLQVVFSPEFLREASALDDMRNQDRIIIGGPKKATKKVRELFMSAFPNTPIHRTNSTNAEMVKYITNCFLAVKVSFANEIYQLCESMENKGVDIDYDRTIELAILDKRLGDSHWKVPGPMPADDGSGKLSLGFGGSCFIKDLNALISLAKTYEVDPKVMENAWFKNLEVRPARDWEKLVGRAVSKKEK